jgi:UDP-2-acetamido-3-amino-2,3-dideoxy-glucuronate N-acetyltransferase
MIHKLSDVQSKKIGNGTYIWQYCVILKNASIGENCNINCNVFIENDVVIGNNVTIKPGVCIWDGISIEDNVMIGPNVTFINDKLPRSKNKNFKMELTKVKNGASIGAGAIIMCGIEIGAFALIGAGTIVTKDIPERALVIGNPARIIGWLNEDGTKMCSLDDGIYCDDKKNKWYFDNGKLIQIN